MARMNEKRKKEKSAAAVKRESGEMGEESDTFQGRKRKKREEDGEKDSSVPRWREF